jgi:hypothetical protein
MEPQATKLEIMECEIQQQEWQIIKSITEHPDAQHYFSWCITPQTISHFTAPPIRLYQLLISAKIGGKDHRA